MEKKKAALLLLENVPVPYLCAHSAEYPELNALIRAGNTTKLVRRDSVDFLISLMGLGRVEEAKGKTEKQTNLEDLYYNTNIKGNYKNLYKGLSPLLLSNDPDYEPTWKKYNISNLILTDFDKLSDILSDQTKERNLVIMHVNVGKLATHTISDSECAQALKIVTEGAKHFSADRRMYLGLFPVPVVAEEWIRPVSTNPYIQSVVPTQSYGFYKSDPVTDAEFKEIVLMVESDRENCRVDEIESLGELVASKKRGGGLWMLAEQFIRQVAFYLGHIGKFGA